MEKREEIVTFKEEELADAKSHALKTTDLPIEVINTERIVEKTELPKLEDHSSTISFSPSMESPTSSRKLWKRFPQSKPSKKSAKKKKKKSTEEEEVVLPSLEVKPFSGNYRLIFFTTVEMFNKKVST